MTEKKRDHRAEQSYCIQRELLEHKLGACYELVNGPKLRTFEFRDEEDALQLGYLVDQLEEIRHSLEDLARTTGSKLPGVVLP